MPHDVKEPKPLSLSREEAQYLGHLTSRLLHAKTERDQKFAEFDERTYLQYFNENEKLANTYAPNKSGQFNDRQGQITVSSGTVEQKLNTIVSEIVRLNLGAEVRSYDKNANELVKLGQALTDIIVKTEDWEGDEEKKINRTVELLKQGTVFVQEQWIDEHRMTKELKNKNNIGKIKGVEWSEKMKKVFSGPRREILYGPGVYLGNIREYTMRNQPYAYTVKVTSYQEAMTRYGQKDSEGNFQWERWPNVPRGKVDLLEQAGVDNADAFSGFSLFETARDRVEEIHYQDPINNEYQITLNGIPMLPPKFPLSAITPDGGFNIQKQILHTINPFFAYGRSFVARTRHLSELLDEILEMLMLKSRKSVHPPYANTGGKVISPKSLMPGRITMGIDPDQLVPIGQEGQGVTAAEFQMLQELRNSIDNVTVSPQLQGQRGQTGTTAFEVNVLQQQAQKLILLAISANTFLEQKLGWLRLNNILANFFTPERTEVDKEKKTLKKVFRQVNTEGNIEGRGTGTRQVIPVNEGEIPSPEEIMDREDFEGTPQPREGERRKTRSELKMSPVEKIFLNVDELKKGKHKFHVQVEQRTRDTSESSKRMFRQELQDLAALVNLGSRPNMEYLEEQHAKNWGTDRSKVFKEQNIREAFPANEQEGQGGDGRSQQQQQLEQLQREAASDENEGGVEEGAPQEPPTPVRGNSAG